MTQAKQSESIRECADCRTVAATGADKCVACGGKNFRSRQISRFANDAIAAFIGIVVVILFWFART
jgi:hypothetical protein